jgi:hypothetical protein
MKARLCAAWLWIPVAIQNGLTEQAGNSQYPAFDLSHAAPFRRFLSIGAACPINDHEQDSSPHALFFRPPTNVTPSASAF